MHQAPPTTDERGDTLIELLVAMAVISIAVVGLLGGLLATTAASTTHRNLATLDNTLRALNTSIQAAVDPPPSSSAAAISYQRCASTSSYQIAGPLYPTSQVVGASVSVAVVGLAASAPMTATLGANPPVSAGTTSANGAGIATFSAPTTAGSYSVTINAGALSVSAGTLTVTPSGAGNLDALSPGPYALQEVFLYWTGSTFTPDPTQCMTSSSNADLQEIQLTLVDSEPGSVGTDTTTLVLVNTNNLASPTESISGPASSVALGTSLGFTANLTGAPTPTGNVIWTFNSDAPANACAGGSNTVTLTAGSAGCTITTAQAGVYTPTATYSGDSNWTGTSSEANSSGTIDTVTVNQAATTLTTSCPGCSQTVGGSITFTATVNGLVAGITPTGTVAWSFPAGNPALASCSNLVSNSGSISAGGTATCQVSPTLAGTYRPTAVYSGDSNYITSTGSQASDMVTVKLSSTSLTSTPSNSAGVGSDLVFTDTVTGVAGVTPTGTVKWTFPTGTPAGAACSGLGNNTGTLMASGPGSATAITTCTVTNSKAGNYQPTATYAGDTDYNGSADNTASVTVSAETPTVNVTGSSGQTNGKTPVEQLTFTAQVVPNLGTDPTPAGTIGWSIATSDTSSVSCTPSPGNLAPDKQANTSSVSCVISPSSPSVIYTATATYTPSAGSSSTYATATGTGSHTG